MSQNLFGFVTFDSKDDEGKLQPVLRWKHLPCWPFTRHGQDLASVGCLGAPDETVVTTQLNATESNSTVEATSSTDESYTLKLINEKRRSVTVWVRTGSQGKCLDRDAFGSRVLAQNASWSVPCNNTCWYIDYPPPNNGEPNTSEFWTEHCFFGDKTRRIR